MKRFEPGQTLTARSLNWLLDAVVRRIRGGRGIQVKRAGDGIIISTGGFSGNAARGIAVVQVTAIKDDYLECAFKDVNGTTSGSVNVAKPYSLRKSVYDDQSIEYTVDSSTTQDITYTWDDSDTTGQTRTAEDDSTSVSETQTVVPNYYVGDELYAVASGTNLTDDSSNAINYVDLNVNARAWGRA